MHNTIRRSLFALIVCSAGWLSPAIAQFRNNPLDEGLPPAAAPLPDDLMRSTGKWVNKKTFDGLQLDNSSQKNDAASKPVYFKSPPSSWSGLLDAAEYFAPLSSPKAARYGRYNVPTNDPVAPSD